MSDLPVPANLGDWMAGVERQLRDLATGNPLNKGAVQNAAGEWVPLSALAFGQVVAQMDTSANSLSLTGPLNSPGGTGWVDRGGPIVDTLVSGSRLRVDFAAALTCYGNNTGVSMSYALLGPTSTAGGAGAPVVFRGDSTIAIQCFTQNLVQSEGAYGSFALHTGLTPGWYRVVGRYNLAYSGTSAPGPWGAIDSPRIAATPF